jgi:hypothetical protein
LSRAERHAGTFEIRPPSQGRMKRLLIWTVISACLLGLGPVVLAQDQSAADRAARRTAERLEREQERAARLQQQADERARRTEERFQRRLDRQFDSGDGAHILLGQDYDLPEGSTTTENVIVFGGTATINGHVDSDVVVVGGSMRLGPKSAVKGDVTVVGGSLDRDPAAQVAGDVHVAHVSVPWSWGWTWPIGFPGVSRFWWDGAALAFTVGRFALVLFLSILLVTVAPRRTSSIAARLVTGPGISSVAGFAGEILFAPALACLAVLLVITIVGIPLLAGLPLVAGAFALTWVAGYATVAGLLGARLRGGDWYEYGIRPVDVFIGSCVLSIVTFVGQVMMFSPAWMAPFAVMVRGTGWTIEYIAWTVGLGAALIAWLRPGGFNPGSAPPVLPPLPSPSAL